MVPSQLIELLPYLQILLLQPIDLKLFLDRQVLIGLSFVPSFSTCHALVETRLWAVLDPFSMVYWLLFGWCFLVFFGRVAEGELLSHKCMDLLVVDCSKHA